MGSLFLLQAPFPKEEVHMSRIAVEHLTFAYESNPEPVFEDVSFSFDTDWKLGLIGRNGRGKTTLLQLLLGTYDCGGRIAGTVPMQYFPFPLSSGQERYSFADLLPEVLPETAEWEVLSSAADLSLPAECLWRPFGTLSSGEKTKLMLAALFAGERSFLLLDEPTNHLDEASREAVKRFLAKKKSFLLVSHDRDLLDACVDHLLVLNRTSIETVQADYSTWRKNREQTDRFREAENEKHLQEIRKLKKSLEETKRWADRSESTKIGFDPVKEHDRSVSTRSWIGSKTKKLSKRAKAAEKRIGREMEEKEGLLSDIEKTEDLKLFPLAFRREVLLRTRDLSVSRGDGSALFSPLTFEIRQGERIRISGPNGCGKSSLLRAVLEAAGFQNALPAGLAAFGTCEVPGGLVISYVPQDTSFLAGTPEDYCLAHGLEKHLFFMLLSKLGVPRGIFSQPMEHFSEGQRKKVLTAASLLTSAHLYIWDEPLNYMDVFSREQVEDLVLTFRPTLLFVEHDVRFGEKIRMREIRLEKPEKRQS